MTALATPAALPTVGDRAPVRLPTHLGLGGLPLGAGIRTLFGLPFTAAGAFALSVAVRQFAGERVPGANAPAAVMLSVGGLFGGVGLWLAVGGLLELVARAGRARRRRRFPDQPWLADYPWERRGGRDRAPSELTRALAFLAVIGAFAWTFGWAGWVGPGGVAFKIAGALLLVFTWFGLVHAARVVWRTLRWGRSRLRFADFPVAPGRELEVIFDDLSPAARTVPLVATLRCVQERWETTGTTEKTTQIVHYEIWRATIGVPAGARSARFTLPPDALGTCLAERPARYWDLELAAEVRGADYRACFLVPVYATR